MSRQAAWALYAAIGLVALWDLLAILRTAGTPGRAALEFFPHAAGLFLLVAIIRKRSR